MSFDTCCLTIPLSCLVKKDSGCMSLPLPRCVNCLAPSSTQGFCEDKKASIKTVRHTCICRTHSTSLCKGHDAGFLIFSREIGAVVPSRVEEKMKTLLGSYREEPDLRDELKEFCIFRITKRGSNFVWSEITVQTPLVAIMRDSQLVPAGSH